MDHGQLRFWTWVDDNGDASPGACRSGAPTSCRTRSCHRQSLDLILSIRWWTPTDGGKVSAGHGHPVHPCGHQVPEAPVVAAHRIVPTSHHVRLCLFLNELLRMMARPFAWD